MTDSKDTQQIRPLSFKTRNIVYVWDADYPWDVRTEKICLALTEAGHNVRIVARNKAQKPVTEQLPEGTVQRMTPWTLLGKKLDTLLGFPAFFSPRWYRLISSAVKKINADLIIVRDIPLCPTALHIGKRNNIPVILDMAENYGAMMQDLWDTDQDSFIDKFVRNPAVVRKVEKWCLARVNHTIVVVEESGQRLTELGVPQEAITVVSNTPSVHRGALVRTNETSDAPSVIKSDSDKVRIVYLGIVEMIRGLKESIDAIRILKDRGTKVHLKIIGSGRDLELLMSHASTIGLDSDNIEFLGFIPYNQALEIVGTADIGLLPHHASESWETTIPNKLFDYMSLGLPVVSSDTKPCTRILEETGAGVVFKSGDGESLAEALISMLDADKRAAAGRAGKDAIASRYNWENDRVRLLKVADHIY